MSPTWRGAASAFLVGAALALAAELSIGLQLYTTDGFMRALTVILAVALGALGVGLANSAKTHHADAAAPGDVGTMVRRRWLLAVGSFAATAAVAFAWATLEDPANGLWRRGFGLALLTALPLYAGGIVLGGLAVAHPTPRVGVGASAVLGAATGVTLQGAVFLGRVEPVSVYLLGIVLLSVGALVDPGASAEEGAPGP